MTWGFIWMMFVLKIPVVMLLWLCWWAIRQVDEPATEDAGGGHGGEGHSPRPRKPRPPRRGAHSAPSPRPPARVRALARRSDSVPTR